MLSTYTPPGPRPSRMLPTIMSSVCGPATSAPARPTAQMRGVHRPSRGVPTPRRTPPVDTVRLPPWPLLPHPASHATGRHTDPPPVHGVARAARSAPVLRCRRGQRTVVDDHLGRAACSLFGGVAPAGPSGRRLAGQPDDVPVPGVPLIGDGEAL